MHDQDKHRELERLYIDHQYSMREACKKAGITEQTGARWKKNDKDQGKDWDTFRNAKSISRGGMGEFTNDILSLFLTSFQESINDIKADSKMSAKEKAETLTKLSDSFVKVTRAASSQNKSLKSASSALYFIDFQIKFIRKEFPQHLSAFSEILESLGHAISNDLKQ